MKMTLEWTVLSREEIEAMVTRVAAEINEATKDVDRPVFVGIMKGAYIWMADILRALERDVETDYIDVSSYDGDSSTGVITINRDISSDIVGKTVPALINQQCLFQRLAIHLRPVFIQEHHFTICQLP